MLKREKRPEGGSGGGRWMVVVASEPPRLCNPGEWSDNAATGFTVLYHPFCLSPHSSLSLPRPAIPRHPPPSHLQLSGTPLLHPRPPLSRVRTPLHSRRTRTLRQTPPPPFGAINFAARKGTRASIEHQRALDAFIFPDTGIFIRPSIVSALLETMRTRYRQNWTSDADPFPDVLPPASC